MRMAAGMQNKLLEGLSAGLPMVISPEANEGVKVPEGNAVLIGRGPEEFATQVLTLLSDRSLANSLAREGMAYVQAQWSWEHNFRILEAHMDKLIADRVLVQV
jgi:glycosyltransferase involved in cell wall biosynthesis